jgi:hypothetical protein
LQDQGRIMMIMPSNNQSGIVHYFAGKYPGRIGSLFSPYDMNNFRGIMPKYIPYAMDNGAFTGFCQDKFMLALNKSLSMHQPLWVAVPDVVADREGTLELWHEWKDRVSSFGYRLAFVAQDGMTPDDVPLEAYCVFIGGSTYWKLNHAHEFRGVCKWLHIGRVNSLNRLNWAERIGADSVDGTGWFRARDKKYYDFIEWFEGSNQGRLF